jgi:hypothetical protein
MASGRAVDTSVSNASNNSPNISGGTVYDDQKQGQQDQMDGYPIIRFPTRRKHFTQSHAVPVSNLLD